MPEQNPQNVAAFNPADFSLPASLSTNEAPKMVYSVIANTDQSSLSCYVQTVFHRSAGKSSPGARLTDQAQPMVRNAEDMQFNSNNDVHSQIASAPQSFAPPIIDAQQYREQNAQPYRLTDQTPAVGDAIYYPPASAPTSESFAPPANRSTLPYAPKENTQRSERSETSKSVLDVSKRNAPTSENNNSHPTRSQALIEKTKLVDLRPRSQESSELAIQKQPARDANTTVEQQTSSSIPKMSAEIYSETGFLKRQAFSDKFSVTKAKAQDKKTTKKVIYLKSTPSEQRSAKLEVPQFKQPVSPITEPVQPQLVPDYAMLPPMPTQVPPAEITSTANEATTMLPEATPTKTNIDFATEPVKTFTSPFEAVEESVEEIIEQPVDTQSLPAEENHQASTSSAPPLQMTESESLETETQQNEIALEANASEFQPTQRPVQTAEEAFSDNSASGFNDSDFTEVSKAEVVDASPAPSTNSHENSFQVVGYRQAKADFQREEIDQTIRSGRQQQPQIILPKFEFNPITSSQKSHTQLTAMTVQNSQQDVPSNYHFETPWLSPWWMLIGLIPLALYLGTTKLFRDEEEEFAFHNDDLNSTESFDFGRDFGKIGGSKSDTVYGEDDSLTKIQSTIRRANQKSADTSRFEIESEPTTSRSTVAFAESLIFELPTTEACANSNFAEEISLDHSPNFSEAVDTEAGRKKKKNRKKRTAKQLKKRRR